MQLSIGMIIKNEEQHLENCLKALQPLKEALDCEIIIADTGSTDNSRAIAEKYADTLLDFEWIDDFSAARNATLDKATGEWFMFIDADEYMDDHQEMIDFFNTGEYKKYNSASYLIRNYVHKSTNHYVNFSGSRMIKRAKSQRFLGTIHEHLVLQPPTKALSTFVHHYGYDNDDPELIKRKAERNRPLMEKELEKDPSNIRMMGLICDCLVAEDRKDEALESFYKQIELHKKQKTSYANRAKAYSGLIDLLVNFKSDYEGAIKTALDFIEEKNQVFSIDIDYYYYIAQASFNSDDKKGTVLYFDKYLSLLEQYEAGNLITIETRFCTVNCASNKNTALKYASIAYFDLEDYEKSLSSAEQIDVTRGDISEVDKDELIFKCHLKLAKYDDIAETYRSYLKTNEGTRAFDYVNKVDSHLNSNGVDKSKLIQAFADSPMDSNYTMLSRLRLAQSSEDAQPYINYLLSQPSLSTIYADVMYYIMKYGFDLDSLIDILDVSQMPDVLNYIGNMHYDFLTLAFTYLKTPAYHDELKALWIISSIKEYVLVANTSIKTLSSDEHIQIFESYANDIITYTNRVYSAEVTSDKNVFIMPDPCKFGYYMKKAMLFKKEKQISEYIKMLKLALNVHPLLNKGINLLLEQISKDMEQSNKATQANQELMQYANVIKHQIRQLISNENYIEASQLITQYRDIISNDIEIDDMELMMSKPQGFMS